MVHILTNRENQIISKKIKGLSLTQNESNILSKTIRPKLSKIIQIDAKGILHKLEYSQKGRAIEEKIKEIILTNMKNVEAIVLCGSAIQTNYKEYNDIDVIIAINKVLEKKDKSSLISKIREEAQKKGVTLDIQIYSKDSIIKQYSYSPSLIYQLKDSKIIYGKINLPKRIELSRLDLMMKLDWSENLGKWAKGSEIYYALRNALLVLLLMNKKVDNNQLKLNLVSILGQDLVNKLKNNTSSNMEKKMALNYLNLLTSYLEEELKDPKWERIEIENH